MVQYKAKLPITMVGGRNVAPPPPKEPKTKPPKDKAPEKSDQ